MKKALIHAAISAIASMEYNHQRSEVLCDLKDSETPKPSSKRGKFKARNRSNKK